MQLQIGKWEKCHQYHIFGEHVLMLTGFFITFITCCSH